MSTRIVSVALRLRPSGEAYTVPGAFRHAHLYEHFVREVATGKREHSRSTDGFLDSAGRFLTRSGARLLAVEAGQAQPSARPLYSDELWGEDGEPL